MKFLPFSKQVGAVLLSVLVASLPAPAISAEPDAFFRTTCAAKAGESGTTVVTGRDGWLFLPAELRHIGAGKFWGADAAKVSKATKPETADPLPAIVDFKEQLAARGIELILVPVPAKALVYPQAVFGEKESALPAGLRLDTVHQDFYKQLSTNGIAVLDLMPDYLAHRDDAGTGVLYCKTDSHWAPRGISLAAEKIAALLDGKDWLKKARANAAVKTVAKEQDTEITGDLAAMLPPDASRPKEKLALKIIGTADSAGATPVAADKASPVVLLGDSHNLVFHAGGDMLAAGAGLPDQLAQTLGIAVDVVAVRGSGATPARVNLMRRAKGDPQYLAGKKVVIWCFSVREFTESSGWAKVTLPPAK